MRRMEMKNPAVELEAIKALKEKLPGCEIITGVDA